MIASFDTSSYAKAMEDTQDERWVDIAIRWL